MPTYEYRCSKGHTFERFQRMTEPPIEVCTVCGAAAERLMSPGVGILFKGSGFYTTDYRSESYKKAAEADSSPKPDTPKKDGGGSSDSAGSGTGKVGGTEG